MAEKQIEPPSEQLAATSLSDDAVPTYKLSDGVRIKSIFDGKFVAGERVRVGGYIKDRKEPENANFVVLELMDGTCSTNLPVIVDTSVAVLDRLVPVATYLLVDGVLRAPEEGSEHGIELQVLHVLHIKQLGGYYSGGKMQPEEDLLFNPFGLHPVYGFRV